MENKKNNKKRILAGLSVTCLSALLMLAGCKKPTPSTSSTSSSQASPSSSQASSSSSSSSSSSQLLNFDENVKFNNLTVAYDGLEHELEINNLPEGASVNYSTTSKFTNAGTYEIKATISKANYVSKEIVGTLTITKANYDVTSVKLDNLTTTYDGNAKHVTLDGTLPTGITHNIKYYSNQTCTNEVTACVNAGTYYAKSTFTGEDANHNKIQSIVATIVIEKAKVSVPTVNNQYFYTGNEIEVVKATDLYNVANGSATIVGDYNVTVVLKDTSNYEWGSTFDGRLNYSIVDPLKDVTYNDLEATYSGTRKDIALANLPENVTTTIKYYQNNEEVIDPINAGEYKVVISFTGGLLGEQILTREKTLVISKAKVAVPVANVDLEYTGEEIVGVNPNPLYTITNGSSVNVGTTIATVTLKDTNNYEWEDKTFNGKVSYTINVPKGIVMTNKSVTYDNTVQKIDIYGLPNATSIYTIKYYKDAAHTEEVSPVKVGKYYALATPISDEYDELTGELTIEKRILEVNVTSTNVTYDKAAHKLEATIASNKIKNTDVSIVVTGEEKINAGEYNFTLSLAGEDKDNYDLKEADKTRVMVISKASVALPTPFDYLYYTGNEVNAFNENELWTVTNGSAIEEGEHTATFVLNDTANYKWADASFNGEVKFTITNPFTDLVVNDLTKNYDGHIKDVVTSSVEGTTITKTYYSDEACTTTVTSPIINAGTYYVKVAYVHERTNEVIEEYKAKILIKRVNLTVKADNIKMAYDGKEHLPQVELKGVVNVNGEDEVINFSFDKPATKAIGKTEYTITLSGDTLINYSYNSDIKVTLEITIPASIEEVSDISTTTLNGTYAIGFKSKDGIIFATTNVENGKTISVANCNSTDTIENYSISPNDLWVITPTSDNFYTIKVGDKYLAPSKEGETKFKLSDTEYKWKVGSSTKTEGEFYLLGFNNKEGERGILMQYGSSTQAIGYYKDNESYIKPTLYKVTKDYAKDVTLKDSYVGGTVEVTSSTGELTGLYSPDKLTLTLTPDEGKMVNSVTIGGQEINVIKGNDGKFTAVIDCIYEGELEVEFIKETAVRNLQLDFDETKVNVSPYKDNYNEELTIKGIITAKEGYYIKDIKLNDTSILSSHNEATGELFFVMPVDVDSKLEIIADNIFNVSKVDEVENGKIYLSSNTIKNGETVTITVDANNRYTFDKLLINGTEVTNYTVSSNDNKKTELELVVDKDMTISVTFKLLEQTSLATIVSDAPKTSTFYLFSGILGSTSNSTIVISDGDNSISLNGVLVTKIKELNLAEGDKVIIYSAVSGAYTTTSKEYSSKCEIVDYVGKASDVYFENSTIIWNGPNLMYDLYYKEEEGEYTLVSSNIEELSYEFDDQLVPGKYVFKLVTHSKEGRLEDLEHEQVWNYGATYTVTFDNKGHGSQVAAIENLKEIPNDLPELIAPGFEFKGWFTKDGTNDDWGNKVVSGTIISKDTTLYAKWTELTAEKTVSVSIVDYANNHSWTNSTKYTSVDIANGIKVEITNGGNNTGKFYTSGKDWRLYFSEQAKITFTSTVGTIKSIKITYDGVKGGALTIDGTTELTSNTVVTVNNDSFEFGVIRTTNDTSGTIVKITAIEVVYEGAGSTEDVNKIAAETAIEHLSSFTSITKENYAQANAKITEAESFIQTYLDNGGNKDTLSNIETYNTVKALINEYNAAKVKSFTEANEKLTNLKNYIDTEELTSESTLTDGQKLQLDNLVKEAEADSVNYHEKYGDYEDLSNTSNITFAKTLIEQYNANQEKDIEETYEFNNSEKRSNYSFQWNTSNNKRLLTSGMFINNTPYVKMEYSSASLQDVSVMDCPVVRNGTVTITTPDSTIKSLTLTLKQYENKTKKVVVNYYSGSNLVKADEASTFTSGSLVLNIASFPANVSKIVLDFSSNDNQVGVSSIKMRLSTKAKNIINANYYATVDDTYTGETLWSTLKELTTNTHEYYSSYADCKYLPYLTDADPEKPGNIIDFYSHLSLDGTWDNGKTWNREHVWCQSRAWYGSIDNSTKNAGTDLHQLRPLYSSINSSRNNSQYGEVANRDSKIKIYNDAPYGYLDGNKSLGKGDGVFEPLDNVKGDVARVLMYMLVRYKEMLNDYPLTNNVYTKENTPEAVYKLLVKWNELDPVDQYEINRNNAVYALQGNRNPFIDCPEYASRIWGVSEN